MKDEIILSTYLVVACYPIIMLLIADPVSVRWWFRHPSAKQMPPETERKSERNEGYLLITKFVILIAGTFWLMRHTMVPPKFIGFRPINLRIALSTGLIAGLILAAWISGMRAAASKLPKLENHVPFLLREPAWKILIIIVLGAFGEEFWRALSLHLLRSLETSIGWSLALTSITFGIGHLLTPQAWPKALGRILRAATGGLFLGVLFLEFHTLLIPFIAHVVVNSFGALMGRKSLSDIGRAAGPSVMA